MNKDVMFSSASNEWTTPKWLFEQLDAEFHFTLDPCSTDENHLCDKYFTIKENGLLMPWKDNVVFVNPPYGSALKDWVKKCFDENYLNNTTVVLLMPARVDTKFFHSYIYNRAEIRFLKGRLKFSNSKNSAPFPSMIVVFKNR
jgi:site-specific DNA-methyltransferase (adenine-specific)